MDNSALARSLAVGRAERIPRAGVRGENRCGQCTIVGRDVRGILTTEGLGAFDIFASSPVRKCDYKVPEGKDLYDKYKFL